VLTVFCDSFQPQVPLSSQSSLYSPSFLPCFPSHSSRSPLLFPHPRGQVSDLPAEIVSSSFKMRLRVSTRPAAAVLLMLGIPAAQALHIPTSHRASFFSLFDRASTVCPTNANLTQCGQGLPSNFCCDLTSTTCEVFQNGTGAICCPRNPDGSPGNCNTMSPIQGGCDGEAYNATLFPTSPIHLKNIPSTFATCGGETNTCCPPGYSCATGTCVAQNSTNPSPSAATTGTEVTLSSAHPHPSTTSASSQAGQSTFNTASAAPTNDFPPTAILVGLFPGIVAGSLLTFLAIVCIGRRRQHRAIDDTASDLGPIRAQVSDPIYHDDGTGRTEFLRRNPNSRGQSIGTNGTGEALRSPALSRVRSLFSRTSASTTPRGLGVGVDTPCTPERQLKREPSMESITIFSPPDMRGGAGDRTTTYSDVLRAAGAQGHDPMPSGYVGSPGIVDPRKRGVDDGSLR
jgi:hypothetical protein